LSLLAADLRRRARGRADRCRGAGRGLGDGHHGLEKLTKYERAAGSFKGWLLHITRWRIADQFRKRAPAALRVSGAQVYLVRHRLSGLVKKAVTAVEKQR